jgi:hypothetical protein
VQKYNRSPLLVFFKEILHLINIFYVIYDLLGV